MRESSTERTLIVEGSIEHISFADLESAIYTLAGLLWQDAIAFRIDGKHGYLVGLNAEAWGDFDPAEFSSPSRHHSPREGAPREDSNTMEQTPVSDACRRAIANFERNAQPGVRPTLLILSRAKYDELRKETEDAHLWSAGLSIPAFCGLPLLIAERPDSHLYPRWSGLAVA